MAGTVHEDLRKFTIISRSVLLRTKNLSDKSCIENKNTHFCIQSHFFSGKSCFMLENVEKCGTADEATDNNNTRIACSITKATNTHSDHVILTAFPRQQWLREHASILRYTFTACLAYPSHNKHYA